MEFPMPSLSVQSAMVLAIHFLLAAPAAAQNLVANGDFASDVSSWNAAAGGSFNHDSALDVNGNPASGSGSALNLSPVAFGTYSVVQCVDGVTAGASYDFGGAIYFDSTAQTAPGRANVVVNFRDGASCAGSSVGGTTTVNVLTTTTDTWVPVEVLATVAPAGSQSVFVILLTVKFDGNPLRQIEAHFDEVFFRSTPVFSVPALPPLGLTLLASALAGTAFWRKRRHEALVHEL